MDFLRWLGLPAGLALAALVVVDVFLTIVHPDLEGPVARRLQLATWRSSLWLARRWRAHRRGLLALAGPLMTAFTFVVGGAAPSLAAPPRGKRPNSPARSCRRPLSTLPSIRPAPCRAPSTVRMP